MKDKEPRPKEKSRLGSSISKVEGRKVDSCETNKPWLQCNQNTDRLGFPWQSSDEDSALPMQTRTGVQSLVRELRSHIWPKT